MSKYIYNICNAEDETIDIEEIPEPTPEFKHWVRTLKYFVDTDKQKEIQDMFLTKIDFDKFKN